MTHELAESLGYSAIMKKPIDVSASVQPRVFRLICMTRVAAETVRSRTDRRKTITRAAPAAK